MLHPWRCDRCRASGLLECWSSDDVLQIAAEIALLHAAASPHCDESDEDGVTQMARYVRVGDWARVPRDGVIE